MPEWTENLAADSIKEVFCWNGVSGGVVWPGRQELEWQGEKAAFSDLGYRVEVQTFCYIESNLSILQVWKLLTK